MTCSDWLFAVGGLKDSKIGWERYHEYLIWLAANDAEQRRQAFDTLCKGSLVGSEEWRETIATDHKEELAACPPRGSEEVGDLKDIIWSEALDKFLKEAGKDRQAAASDQKSAQWKIELAAKLRNSTTAPHRWIAAKLNMGKPSSLSVYLSRRRRQSKN